MGPAEHIKFKIFLLSRRALLKIGLLFICLVSCHGKKESQCLTDVTRAIDLYCSIPEMSCQERCGAVYSRMRETQFKKLPCACDKLCKMNNDCCRDFDTLCPDELETSLRYSYILDADTHVCFTDMHQVFISYSGNVTLDSFHSTISTIPTIPTISTIPPTIPTSTENVWSNFGFSFMQERLNHVLDTTSGVMYLDEVSYDNFKTSDSKKVFVPMLVNLEEDGGTNTGRFFSLIDSDSYFFSRHWPFRRCVVSPHTICQTSCPNQAFVRSSCIAMPLSGNWVPVTDVDYSLVKCSSANHKEAVNSNGLPKTFGVQRVRGKNGGYLLNALNQSWPKLYCSKLTTELDECQVLQCGDAYLPLDASTCFKPNQAGIIVSGSKIANKDVSEQVGNLKPASLCICLWIPQAFRNVFPGHSIRLYSQKECKFTIVSSNGETERDESSVLDELMSSVTVSEIDERIRMEHLDTFSKLQKEIELQLLSLNQCQDLHAFVHVCFNTADNNRTTLTYEILYQHLKSTDLHGMQENRGTGFKCYHFITTPETYQNLNESSMLLPMYWLVVIEILSVLVNAVTKVQNITI